MESLRLGGPCWVPPASAPAESHSIQLSRQDARPVDAGLWTACDRLMADSKKVLRQLYCRRMRAFRCLADQGA